MANPADLSFTSKPDPSDKDYTLLTINPLQVASSYKFQFQWVFEDSKLNDEVGDEWSNIYTYGGKSATVPSAVTSLTANWTDAVNTRKDILYVRFTHDTTSSGDTTSNKNSTVDKYFIRLVYNPGPSQIVYEEYWTDFIKTNSSKVWTMTESQNKARFGGFFRDQFQVTVIPVDTLNRVQGGEVTVTSSIAPNPLNPPVIDVNAAEYEYRVFWNEQDLSVLEGIYIEENVTNSPTEPSSNDPGWTVSPFKKRSLDNPVAVPCDTNQRYVRAYFKTINGQSTGYSNVKKTAGIDPVTAAIDTTPPTTASSVTAGWSGDNITISATVSADAKKFIIRLTNGLKNGYFTKFPAVSGTSQTITITKAELFSAFGEYLTSFPTSLFISADAADNRDAGKDFSVPLKTNTLQNATPTFELTAITNGYSVKWPELATQTLPAQYSYAKIYENSVSWGAGNPTDDTLLVFSGQSPAVIKKTIYNKVYIKIRYISDDGFTSAWSAEKEVTPINSITADTTAPAAPSAGLSVSSGIDNTGTMGFNGFINLSWTAVDDSSVRGYRIRFRPSTTPVSNYSYADSPKTVVSPNIETYRLSGLAVGVTYEIAIASYDEFNNTTGTYQSFTSQTIPGTPAISSYITAGANGFQFGSGIKNSSGLQDSSIQGLYLSNSNYWYLTGNDAAQLKVGGSKTVTQTTSSISNSAQALVTLSSASGILVGQTVTGSASIPANTTILRIVGTTITLSNNLTNSIASGTILTFSGVFTGLNWNGANFSIDGDINARGGSFTGNIALSTAGASIYNGTLTSSGALSADGFIFNQNGLVIKKGTVELRLDSTDGGLYAQYGRISNWYIKTNSIENVLSGTSSVYTGIASSGSYAFWAGSSTAGGDASAKFSVTHAGAVTARSISIIGDGSSTTKLIEAGTGFFVQNNGYIEASNAKITGNIIANSGKIGNINVDSASLYISSAATPSPTAGNRIIFNSGGIAAYRSSNTIDSGIAGTESNLPTTTATVTNATWASNLVTFTCTNSFSDGQFVSVYNATNSAYNISGNVQGRTATSFQLPLSTNPGTFSGNAIAVGSTGPTFAITREGLGLFSRGQIGGWEINHVSISKAGGIELNSASNYIAVNSILTGNNFTTGIASPTSSTDIVLWAGQQSVATRSNAAFRVTAGGALTATSAAITGNITATGGFFTGNLNFGSPISVTYTVTSASISGSFITYVISNPTTPFQLSSGSTVTISGASNNGYNGAKVIDSVLSATSFRVPVGSTSGTTTFSGGQAVGTPVAARIGIAAGGSGLHGIYIPNTQGTSNPAGDFMYSDGSFSFGGGQVKGTANSISFDFNKYTSTGQGMFFTNMLSGDDDNWAGDPTITVRDSDFRVVKGRRFVFDPRVTGIGTDLPVNPKDLPAGSTITDARTGLSVTLPNPTWTTGTTKTGYYKRKTATAGVFEYYPVKVGDLLLID